MRDYRRCVSLVLVLGLFLGLGTWGSAARGQVELSGSQRDSVLELGGTPSAQVLTVSAEFTAPSAGQPGYLYVTATLQPGWHIYSITQASGGPVATQIKLKPSDAYQVQNPFQALTAPEKKREPLYDNMTVETHQGKTTWRAPVELAPGVDPERLKIEGSLYAQVCDAKNCLMPDNYSFVALRGQAPSVTATTPPLDWSGLAMQLVFAFLGGLILNVMPCVLPVIGLKILAFVQQAGESRGRVFLLNVWYSLGVLAVFLVLAFLAAGANQVWGEQFTDARFKVALTAIVFAMALSFLGVWEIPIPGFMGSGSVSELQNKEGVNGAFFKGVFATILATPCSGPLLGSVFAYALNKPPVVAYCVFGAMGVGMAAPYLLIGAFPRLIRFLPRPGVWMEVLKEVMAFFLLGTVVYLFSTLTAAYFVPTLTLLVGIWFGVWLIGRTPLTVSPLRRVLVWATSLSSAGLIGVLAFTLLLHQPLLPWQPYSPEALAKARQEGKTVMVDFTANWCLTCKTNLVVAIERKAVKQLVDENQVVCLLADWTDGGPTIKQAINDLGYNSIPLLVIWPAGSTKPIILTDLLTQGTVLEKLKEAGPSRPSPAASQTP